MPLTLERTYYTDTDYALPDTSTTTLAAQSFLWCLAASLTKDILATNCSSVTAWTVVGSSDSATAGLDGVNRWGTSFDATKIVRGAVNGTNANSWIVLKHPTTSIWLTIQYVSAALNCCTMVVAKVAPTGGTTTSRPTSTNERVFINGYAFIESLATAGKVHRVFDSESYPIICMSRTGNGRMSSLLAIQKLTETKRGDTDPWCVIWDQAPSGVGASVLLTSNTTTGSGTGLNQWRANNAVAPCTAWMVNGTVTAITPMFWEGAASTSYFGTTLTTAETGDSKFDDMPIFLTGVGTQIGYKGRLYDWRITAGPKIGDITPSIPPDMTHLMVGTCWIPFTVIPTT